MDYPGTTFEACGRALGLTEESVIEALVIALRTAGPGAGGRFVGPNHVVGDDWTSSVAVEAMRGFVQD